MIENVELVEGTWQYDSKIIYCPVNIWYLHHEMNTCKDHRTKVKRSTQSWKDFGTSTLADD